ncbi:hypothetical protein HDU81_009203, partial [Chytriomyces hyalinus]
MATEISKMKYPWEGLLLFGTNQCYTDLYLQNMLPFLLTAHYTLEPARLSPKPSDASQDGTDLPEISSFVYFAWTPMEEGLGLVTSGRLAGHVVRFARPRGFARMGPIPAYAFPYMDLGPFIEWLETFVASLEGGDRIIQRVVVPSARLNLRGPSVFLNSGPGTGSAITRGVKVHVSTFFILSMARVCYRISLEYIPSQCPFEKVQLLARQWVFRYRDGRASRVQGEGVIGEFPILSASSPTFSYCSYSDGGRVSEAAEEDSDFDEDMLNVRNPVVSLEGSFEFVPGTIRTPVGDAFDTRIPFVEFQLPRTIARVQQPFVFLVSKKKKRAQFNKKRMLSGSAMQEKTVPSFASIWSGFHKKALRERQNQLRLVYPALFPSAPTQTSQSAHSNTESDADSLLTRGGGSAASLVGLNVDVVEWSEDFPVTGLDEKVADNMIENCIGTMGLPVGLALNFVINGTPTVIPMVVEEPSVVAAVSGAAKTISTFGGGFTATTSERNIIFAQVVIMDVVDVNAAAETIRGRSQEVIDIANSFVPNMLARGGGVVGVTVRVQPRFKAASRPRKPREVNVVGGGLSDSWLVVHLHLDVCDAMGANAASTVSEGVAPFLSQWVGGRIGLRIVSNLCVERLAKATFRMPLAKMAYKSFTGRQVASRMIEAVEWANDDPFRASTHNKGIMNGVDAVAVATGQDWRAIEAAAHAWAAGCGQEPEQAFYKPLTHYWVEADEGVELVDGSDEGLYLCGEMEMPISVGTKGGVLKTNPVYTYTLGMMGNPDSKGLARAMISVGLAQNFA